MTSNRSALSLPDKLIGGLVHFFLRGGEVYLHEADADDFLQRCLQSGTVLLGFDTFFVLGNQCIPSLFGILDLSELVAGSAHSAAACKTSVAACVERVALLRRRPNELYTSLLAPWGRYAALPAQEPEPVFSHAELLTAPLYFTFVID